VIKYKIQERLEIVFLVVIGGDDNNVKEGWKVKKLDF